MPTNTDSFGTRCAKKAAAKNFIMMGTVPAVAAIIDAERAALRARADAGTPLPGDVIAPPAEKPKKEKKPKPEAPQPFGDPKQIPPSPENVTAYSASIGYPLKGEEFCDHYAVKGWKIKGDPMKNWQAAVRNWKTNKWGVPVKMISTPGNQPLRKF